MKSYEDVIEKRAKSQYAIGKNPNSHRGKGASMASQGTTSPTSGKLLLQDTSDSKNRVSGGKKHQPKKEPKMRRVGGHLFDPKMEVGGSWTAEGRARHVKENSRLAEDKLRQTRDAMARGRNDEAWQLLGDAKRAHQHAKDYANNRRKGSV